MIAPPLSSSPCVQKVLRNPWLLTALALAAATPVKATGYYGPSEYLSEGGKNVDGSPEFYWDFEVKRLAKAYHPPEKYRESPPSEQPEEGNNAPAENRLVKATANADLADFAAALKAGEIHPTDPKKATGQHEAARAALAAPDANPNGLPEEFNSEFSDYHRGARAFQLGNLREAADIWQKLLNRPPAERHFRSTWAAFMLGKTSLKQNDPQASKWFQATRALAKDGFADTLCMAADSYGWEARSEWKQHHPEKAAPLYLTQLALGDESAIVSLKALIPDRQPVEGLLNYGPEAGAEPINQQINAVPDAKTVELLKAAASDPLLRRLITAHILATASSTDYDTTHDGQGIIRARSNRWLEAMQLQKGPLEDAEHLGWIAYVNGDYKEAERWLELSAGNTPAACWLRAKLQRRAGHLGEAAKSLEQAWQPIREAETYRALAENGNDYIFRGAEDKWTFSQSVSGDLGALRLTRGDFVQAMDVFRRGDLWNDAAYVAERVLTTAELQAYIDAQLPESDPPKPAAMSDIGSLRYLLGRRLVREDRYEDALKYLPPPNDRILRKYMAALATGADPKKTKLERARAWFTAAWLARYDGMEIMGTEVAPDSNVTEGAYRNTDLAKERRTGVYETSMEQEDGKEKKTTHPVTLAATKEEVQRLTKNKIEPDVRYHYRVIAGAIAMRAAPLLDDNTEALADVINTAGGWVKNLDEKVADRYYETLKKRCSKTKIGQAAIAARWFADKPGAWSEEQEAEEKAMHDKFEAENPDFKRGAQ